MPESDLELKYCSSVDQPGWLALRQALWPDCSQQQHLQEMAAFAADPDRYIQLLACTDTGQAVGFIEASLRQDYVNGTNSSPVAFLEGIYVIPLLRQQGVARRLLQAVETWAIEHGCQELASDVLGGNELGQTVHGRLGFQETERVVFFCKSLDVKHKHT